MTAGDFFDEDPFGLPPSPGQNAPREMTVSELSLKLKRTVEDEFSFVRVRGEISKVTIAKSGHLYTSLKDADAVLDSICWKGTVGRLGIKPEEGMDVVCTGRLTTYPGRSNYQLIIETMELAGAGALLKMLEDRKKKLAAEGLFDAARKRAIPYLPRTIGIITSPTGAVIRDIMHRLNERFPRHVLLWPVVVQGQTAAESVAAAIEGFNLIPEGSPDRPDILIVARGGGSMEDLMPFNDERLVRAAAHSKIPLISAVGHETDTTLIDYAADLRAPTPTAAAEKAVPVRREILARVIESEKRLITGIDKFMKHARMEILALARGLGDPARKLDHANQKLDHLSLRLDQGLTGWLDRRRAKLNELEARISLKTVTQRIGSTMQLLATYGERLKNSEGKLVTDRQRKLADQASRLSLKPFQQKIVSQLQLLSTYQERLRNSESKVIGDRARKLDAAASLLNSLSFERVLERGYTVVFDKTGQIVSSAKDVSNDELNIRFKDGVKTVKSIEK